MAEKAKDPYQVLLKANKLPMSLLQEPKGITKHPSKSHIESQPFSDTFGPKAQRKRPKISVSNVEELVGESKKMEEQYEEQMERNKLLSGNSGDVEAGWVQEAKDAIFSKGQSKRIWNELYKVIDSSDVIIHAIDARDPLGTRCRSVEKYIKEEAPHKHLIFVLNKCDLVPTSVAVSFPIPFSHSLPPPLSTLCVPSLSQDTSRASLRSRTLSSMRGCLLQLWQIDSSPLINRPVLVLVPGLEMIRF